MLFYMKLLVIFNQINNYIFSINFEDKRLYLFVTKRKIAPTLAVLTLKYFYTLHEI